MWGDVRLKEFIDRISENPKRKKITYEDGTTEYVEIEDGSEIISNGTPINRANMMSIQGFQAKTTTFSADGKTITETNSDGHKLVTTFNDDGSITEKFTGTKTMTKKTTFNPDGSITEVIS